MNFGVQKAAAAVPDQPRPPVLVQEHSLVAVLRAARPPPVGAGAATLPGG